MNSLVRSYPAVIDDVDTEKREVVAKVSVGDIDRYRTVIESRGISLDSYRENPVVLFEHGKDPTRGAVPIGKCLWIRPDAVGNGRILAKTRFAKDDFSQMLLEFYRDGTMRGWSIMAIPRKASAPTREEIRTRPDLANCELIYRETDLGEYSAVSVPGAPGALSLPELRSLSTLVVRGFYVPGDDVKPLIERMCEADAEPESESEAAPDGHEADDAITRDGPPDEPRDKYGKWTDDGSDPEKAEPKRRKSRKLQGDDDESGGKKTTKTDDAMERLDAKYDKQPLYKTHSIKDKSTGEIVHVAVTKNAFHMGWKGEKKYVVKMWGDKSKHELDRETFNDIQKAKNYADKMHKLTLRDGGHKLVPRGLDGEIEAVERTIVGVEIDREDVAPVEAADVDERSAPEPEVADEAEAVTVEAEANGASPLGLLRRMAMAKFGMTQDEAMLVPISQINSMIAEADASGEIDAETMRAIEDYFAPLFYKAMARRNLSPQELYRFSLPSLELLVADDPAPATEPVEYTEEVVQAARDMDADKGLVRHDNLEDFLVAHDIAPIVEPAAPILPPLVGRTFDQVVKDAVKPIEAWEEAFVASINDLAGWLKGRAS